MVSRRTTVAIAAPFATAYAWCVAATVIFCFGVRHPQFLAFPYLLRHGTPFWWALAGGLVLTLILYSLTIVIAARFGVRL